MASKKILPAIMNVAEKASVAKQISKHFAYTKKFNNTISKFNPVYEFQMDVENIKSKMFFTSVRGHVKELSFKDLNYKNNWQSYKPQQLITAEIIEAPLKQNKDIVANIQNLASTSDTLILWLDCDQEGQAIAFEIKQICQKINPNLIIKRARFSSLGKNELYYAINNLTTINMNQVEAVRYRQEIDFRIGCVMTNFQTIAIGEHFKMTFKNPLTFGTCQFPLLNIIIDKYLHKLTFRPVKFWEIDICCSQSLNFDQEIWFQWNNKKIQDQNLLQQIYDHNFPDQEAPYKFKVQKIQTKKIFKPRPYPLTTSTLLKFATEKFKLTSSKVMEIAEKLYQKGLISYPRTETNRYPKSLELTKLVSNFLEHKFFSNSARQILSQGLKPKYGSSNDNAHTAIYPVIAQSNFEVAEQKIIYQFIVQNFLCGLNQDAEAEQKTIIIQKNDLSFILSGKTITKEGFLKFSSHEKWFSKSIPKIEIGQQLVLKKVKVLEKKTNPPEKLTQSRLISLMEQYKIGTDSTIHEHIKNIQNKNYAQKINEQFKPTKLGISLVSSYKSIKNELCNPKLRAQIEQNVRSIANEQVNYKQKLVQSMNKFKQMYLHLQKNKDKFLQEFGNLQQISDIKQKEETISLKKVQCYKCKQQMKLVIKTNSRYFACQPCDKIYFLPKQGLFNLSHVSCYVCKQQVINISKNQHSYSICLYCYNNPQSFMMQQQTKSLPCFKCIVKQCVNSPKFKAKGIYKCQKCQSGNMVPKKSTYGNYIVACNSFPKCKNLYNLPKYIKNVVITNNQCPKCKASLCKIQLHDKVEKISIINKYKNKEVCISHQCNSQNQYLNKL